MEGRRSSLCSSILVGLISLEPFLFANRRGGDYSGVNMGQRGVFFAITSVEANKLLSASSDDEVIEIVDESEDNWDEDNLAECDKSWDALHRLLTDGSLSYGNGTEPLCHCVLGPNQLYQGDGYIVSLVEPTKVKEVAKTLSQLSKQWFDDRYHSVVPADYAPEYGPEDLEYTWDWFQSVRELYQKAAGRDRYVIFTVDA